MVAKQAGQFAGGFFNNPGVVAAIVGIAAIGIPLLVFRKQIAEFFGRSFGEAAVEGAGAAVGSAFESAGEAIGGVFSGAGETVGEFFGGVSESISDAIGSIGEVIEGGLPEIGDVDFTESGQAAARGARGGVPDEDMISTPGVEEPTDFGVTIAPSLLDSIIGPFIGGGPSFEGGTIFETPIEFLSLNQIIEMGLAETASEAASLQAEAIGFTPEEEAFLAQGEADVGGFVAGGPAVVSDPVFEGLTAEEIALRLTGGNISNF